MQQLPLPLGEGCPQGSDSRPRLLWVRSGTREESTGQSCPKKATLREATLSSQGSTENGGHRHMTWTGLEGRHRQQTTLQGPNTFKVAEGS